MDKIDIKNIEIVKEQYFNPLTGLGSAQKIYEELNKKIKLKDIKLILQNIDVKQIKTNKINKKSYIPIVSEPKSFQCDLTFYTQFTKNNNGFHILLTIINMNSKYAYVYPLKNKNTDSIINAMEKFIIEQKDIKIIESDKGSEFISQRFKDLCDKNDIKLLIFDKASSPNAMAIIERFNKTIRSKIDTYMKSYDTKKYIDVLDKLVTNYNSTKSYATHYKPIEVNDNIEKKLFVEKTLKKKEILNEINNDFQIGDFVRILKTKKLFSKGDKYSYSKGIYEIIEKINNQYKLKNTKNDKIKMTLPYQLQIINNNEVITNPFKKDNKILEKDKKIFDKSKNENKQNKKLIKEGIYDTIIQDKDKKKLEKKLLRNGINVKNIIK